MYSEVLQVEKLDSATVTPAIQWILEKQPVITMVTAVEVYFRDMLDGIFRLCKPEAFQPVLKELHKVKYDIDELLDFYVKRVHPVELVVDSFNFQNSAVIASVFSKLMRKPLWSSVIGLQLRVKDQPETEVTLESENLASFERTVRLRHELIHNPDLTRVKLAPIEWVDLHLIAGLIFGCDVVINNFIAENLDEEIKQNATKTQVQSCEGSAVTSTNV